MHAQNGLLACTRKIGVAHVYIRPFAGVLKSSLQGWTSAMLPALLLLALSLQLQPASALPAAWTEDTGSHLSASALIDNAKSFILVSLFAG